MDETPRAGRRLSLELVTRPRRTVDRSHHRPGSVAAAGKSLTLLFAAALSCVSSTEKAAVDETSAPRAESGPAHERAVTPSADAERRIDLQRQRFDAAWKRAIRDAPVPLRASDARFERVEGGARVLVGRPIPELDRRLSVRLPSTAAGSLRLRDERSGLEIELTALDHDGSSELEVARGIAVYKNAAPGGGDVFYRVGWSSAEDFAVIEAEPARRLARYSIRMPPGAGLRLVSNVLEVVDGAGAPRLRMRRPFLVDARGRRIGVAVGVRGCRVDRSPAPPWDRPPTPPGAESCEVRLSWSDDVVFPALLDPAWVATGSLAEPRFFHVAERLPDGRVLIAAGRGQGVLSSAEVYDPTTGTWAVTGDLNDPRKTPTSEVLPSGRVLVAGGPDGVASLTTSEIYDPTTGMWTLSAPMNAEHRSPESVALDDGRVLMTTAAVAEVYQEVPAGWTRVDDLGDSRIEHALVKLGDGRVLAAGGTQSIAIKTCEIFDPMLGTWAPTTSLSTARRGGASALLSDGRVMVVGGFVTSVEIFDPSSETWSDAGTFPNSASQVAVPLDNGSLLVAGGAAGPRQAARVFDPVTDSWLIASDMLVPREQHSGTLLDDGSVLVAGGFPDVDTAEVFTLIDQGAPCTSPGDCRTGRCVDGVCCDSECAGACMSCRGADQASGSDGQCGAVQAGTDPNDDCADDGAPSCGKDGTCDGAGACADYPVASGCTPRPCTSHSECASGACADGICCDSSCGGCRACTAALKGSGVDGVCDDVAADTDPHDACALGVNYPTSCLSDGLCDGNGSCREFAKDTTSCGATQCIGGNAVGLLCNGAGQCLQGTAGCEPYECRNDACLTACSDDNDCVGNAYCTSTGACAEKLVQGSACSSGNECESGFCVDQVCCDAACNGQCEACDEPPNVGSCSTLRGAPRAPRPPCVDLGDGCGGECDGVDPSGCRYPGSDRGCGVPSCEAGVARTFACNDRGECSQQPDRACGAYACGPDGCRTACTEPSDCADGFSCTGAGQCAPGAQCSNDGLSSSVGSSTRACTPFACDPSTGSCFLLCDTSDECAPNHVCDATLRACVQAEAPVAEESGCGCRIAPSDSRAPLLAGLLVMIAGSARRRERRAA